MGRCSPGAGRIESREFVRAVQVKKLLRQNAGGEPQARLAGIRRSQTGIRGILAKSKLRTSDERRICVGAPGDIQRNDDLQRPQYKRFRITGGSGRIWINVSTRRSYVGSSKRIEQTIVGNAKDYPRPRHNS